jgi:hypothetical protein
MYLSIHPSNILVKLILFGSFPIWAWIKGRKILRVLIKLSGRFCNSSDTFSLMKQFSVGDSQKSKKWYLVIKRMGELK